MGRAQSRWVSALATAAAAAFFMTAAAAGQAGDSHSGLVFVQTNEPPGNQIVVFDRDGDGHLARAGSYATGGQGGAADPGTESDHLASQGSLAYDASANLLIAVNAGSDTLSTFRVHGDKLERTGITPSGGDFPASVAIHDDLVYVLNAGGAGTVAGFRIGNGRLTPLAGSVRTLSLGNGSPPNFLTSPGQVGFTPDGTKLIVTTKASDSRIDVFTVGPDGRLSSAPIVNTSATPVPFAFTFAPSGRLVVGEAGASSVTTYRIGSDGTLAEPKSQSDGQTALCWIQRVGDFYYVSNTGSNTISAYRLARDGRPFLVSDSGVVATTEPGPIDLASPLGSTLLYAETGFGTLTGYRVASDGTLTTIGRITDLPAGIEGLVAT